MSVGHAGINPTADDTDNYIDNKQSMFYISYFVYYFTHVIKVLIYEGLICREYLFTEKQKQCT